MNHRGAADTVTVESLGYLHNTINTLIDKCLIMAEITEYEDLRA